MKKLMFMGCMLLLGSISTVFAGQLYIRMLSGKNATINYDESTTILDIKKELQDKYGTPADDFFLYLKGIKYTDDQLASVMAANSKGDLFSAMMVMKPKPRSAATGAAATGPAAPEVKAAAATPAAPTVTIKGVLLTPADQQKIHDLLKPYLPAIDEPLRGIEIKLQY